MRKTVIYTQRVEIVESYNERRDCADQRIPDFISQCGYLPVACPNNKHISKELVASLKPIGIILTGGNSLVRYGGNAIERDETDRMLIQCAIDNNIPLYGFCRGMQSILDYFGNELVNVEGHVATKHIVCGNDCSMNVNSYHNQGCIEMKSSELQVVLKTEDGVIEMIRHKSLPIVGTMWHPERENPFKNEDLNMITELFGGTGE